MKQQRFVDEYLLDCNATRAAIRAGYSRKTARQAGARLLTNVDISAAIEDKRRALSERTGVTLEWVVSRLKEISERGLDEGRYRESVRALALLGRHLGMFKNQPSEQRPREIVVLEKAPEGGGVEA